MHRCFWCFRPNCLAEPELCRDMRLIPSPSLGIWLVSRVTPATAAPVNRHVPEDVCLSLMACTEHGRLPSLDTPENWMMNAQAAKVSLVGRKHLAEF